MSKAKMGCYISINVDDLDARDDPARSGRICSHNCTPEEIEIALNLVKSIKQRLKVRTDIVGALSPESIKANEAAWDRNHPDGEE